MAHRPYKIRHGYRNILSPVSEPPDDVGKRARLHGQPHGRFEAEQITPVNETRLGSNAYSAKCPSSLAAGVLREGYVRCDSKAEILYKLRKNILLCDSKAEILYKFRKNILLFQGIWSCFLLEHAIDQVVCSNNSY